MSSDITWSVTKMNTLRNCPRQFQLKYLQKVKKPAYGDALCIGSGLGKCFEEYSKFHNNKLTISQLVDIYNKEALSHPAVASRENVAKHAYMVRQYFGNPANIIKPAILDGEPMVEYKLEFEVKGIKFLGYIDIVSASGYVVDYKTSKNPYARKDLEPFSEKGLQLTAYALGYYEKFGRVPNVGFQVIVKKDPISIQKLFGTRTLADISQMRTKIIEYDTYVKTHKTFRTIRSYRCKFCAYFGAECLKGR